MKKIFSISLLLFVLVITEHAIAQPGDNKETKDSVKKWFKKKEWLGGLQLQPHESINQQTFARQYNLHKTYWDKAFAFLKEKDLQTLAVGKYPIDGDSVYATVTENPTKDYDSTKWESHRNYVDLQYVISGEEKIGVSQLPNLTITKVYDPSKDLQNYSGEGKLYKASPGTFFLFFPSDAHRPNITTSDNKADIRKIPLCALS